MFFLVVINNQLVQLIIRSSLIGYLVHNMLTTKPPARSIWADNLMNKIYYAQPCVMIERIKLQSICVFSIM